MPRQIKVGVLIPYSTIYPSLGQDLQEGIWCGLSDKLHLQIQFVSEFIHQGQPSAIKPALEKLFMFEQVDMVTGLVGYRSIVESLPLIEQTKKLALFADMGEYIPFDELTSQYLFFNSFQYWQAEFALGQWAQQSFGGKGAILMPIYDGGYHMHTAFRHGTLMAGNQGMEYATIHFDQQENYSVRDAIQEYLDKFKKERPDYLHALFCGGEAKDFFELYHQSGLHKEVPLVVSPHMASYEILKDVENLDMTFHAASLWNLQADDIANTRFRQRYIDRMGMMPTIFSLLGYEIGLVLEQIAGRLAIKDFAAARQVLRNEEIHTPRGNRSFHLDSNYSNPVIDIEKVKIANNKSQKLVVGQGKALPYNHDIYKEIHRENSSGWLNAYLCV